MKVIYCNKIQLNGSLNKYYICLISILCIFLFNNELASFEYSNVNNAFISNASGKTSFGGCDYSNNPALISFVDSFLISLSVSPLKFGIPELSPAQLFFGKRLTSNISAGLSIAGIGNQLFSEYSGSAYVSYGLGDKIVLGATFEYSHLFIKDYSSEGIFMLHIGALIRLSEMFTAAFSMQNTLKSYYSGGDKTATQQAVIGLGLSLSRSLFIDLDAHIDINKASGFSSAFKYDIIDILSLRIAYLTNPSIIECGGLLKISDAFSLAINFSYHNFLGFSQKIMINLIW